MNVIRISRERVLESRILSVKHILHILKQCWECLNQLSSYSYAVGKILFINLLLLLLFNVKIIIHFIKYLKMTIYMI